MRVATAYAQTAAIEAITERQSRQLALQQQLSTGRRFTSPGDDPVAAAEGERLRSREARIQIELRATGFARQMLGAAETTVADAADTLQFARETMLTAANPVYGARDRVQMAEQLRQARAQLLQIANRVDGSGGYVFGGQGSAGEPIPASGTAYLPQPGVQQVGLEQVNPVSLDGRENLTAVRTAAGTESVFAQLDAAVAALEDAAATPAAVATAMRAGVDGVDRSLERLQLTRVMIGERLRAIDVHETALQSGSLDARARLSELVDLDFTQGISELTQHQTVVEAAMKSYAQVARLSLFDFI